MEDRVRTESTLHTRVVQHACNLLGMNALAERLKVSTATLQKWRSGGASPPPPTFFRLLDIMRQADPAYRPFEGK
jgi:DNA-binding transcriptional regulator YiaG